MPYCTDCGGSIEQGHRYCYSCGSPIGHSENVVEDTTPDPTSGRKTLTKRRVNWKWIGGEVVMLLGALWTVTFVAGFVSGRYGGVEFAMQIAIGAAVVYLGGTIVWVAGGEIPLEEWGERSDDDTDADAKITPIWMRVVGIGLMLVGMLMTVDIFRYMLFGASDDVTYWLVDNRARNPGADALLLAVIGVGFVGRWGLLVAGGEDIEGWASPIWERLTDRWRDE